MSATPQSAGAPRPLEPSVNKAQPQQGTVPRTVAPSLDLVCPLGQQINPFRNLFARRVLGFGFITEAEFVRWMSCQGCPWMTAVSAQAQFHRAWQDALRGDASRSRLLVEVSVRVITHGVAPLAPPCSTLLHLPRRVAPSLDLVCPEGQQINPHRNLFARRVLGFGFMDEATFVSWASNYGCPPLTAVAAQKMFQVTCRDALHGDATCMGLLLEISVRVTTDGIAPRRPE
jgi:hypothetical protein